MNTSIYPQNKHHLTLKQFDQDALKVISRLQRNGFKAYIVGGGVRDLLLGKKPKDFDIASDATPKKVKSVLPYSRIIGKRFKLVHVYSFSGKIIEVSTFRDKQDYENSGITGEVSLIKNDNIFGTEETDAIRRDITINGLFFDPSTLRIYDYVGGFKDLKNHIVRVIGEPDLRFAEDPVRLLRVVRHAARSSFSIEPKTFESLKVNAQLLKKSSVARVYDEIKKDLCSGSAAPFFKLLEDTGLLKVLFPKIASSVIKENGSCIIDLLTKIDSMVSSGENLPTTVILAAILLVSENHQFFSGYFNPEHLLLRDATGILVRDFYENLSISKKEGDIIRQAINGWLLLIDKATELNMFKNNYPFINEDIYKDLYSLIRILPDTPYDKEIFYEFKRHAKHNHTV